MLHSSSNRATSMSVDNITKLVRQHYKPDTEQEYSHEKVQCRTDTICQKSKPEDYWTTNFYRRMSNLHKGFYTISTRPYRPIGGELILDPCELALSTFPGTLRKISPQMARRGTIHEEQKTESGPSTKDNGENESSPFSSMDLVDTAPSAGYEDIKKVLKESRHRITSVRAEQSYEGHVLAVEEREKEANKPDDSVMVLRSVSSMFMSDKSNKSSQPGSNAGTRKCSDVSVLSPISDKETKSQVIKAPSPTRRQSAWRTTIRPPSLKKKVTVVQVGTGLEAMVQRKERQLKDHLLYLKSIYRILTALHNLKVKDIRSKVPLTKEVVERLQKDDMRGSHGTHVSHVQGKQRGPKNSTHSFRVGTNSRRTSVESEFGDIEDFSPRKRGPFLPKIRKTSRSRGTQLSMEGEQGDYSGGHLSVFNTAKRLNNVQDLMRNMHGRSSRMARKGFRVDLNNEHVNSSQFLSAFNSVAKTIVLDDQVNKTIMQFKGGPRRSKNAANNINDRQALETWEDLLNVQPEPYKEESSGGMFFQIGVVAKFMRWYRKLESATGERENEKRKSELAPNEREKIKERRRASIIPSHVGGQGAPADKSQLSHLQNIHEKGLQGGERDTYGQQQSSVAAQPVERIKKLPIWQQVAQEKSTVFKSMKQKAPDGTVRRIKRNFNKLKRNVQKENTRTLEKIVRERAANFRLKFSTLNSEDCSPILEKERLKLQEVKDIVKKSHLDIFDVQPSKWFEELKEKTTHLMSSYDQPQMKEMLVKVQTYALMDNKTISYAKAKLCLLMMSLPAYDICHIYMQEALMFIFENILLGQKAQYYEWLNHRKIPNMVVVNGLSSSDSSSPVRESSSPTRGN